MSTKYYDENNLTLFQLGYRLSRRINQRYDERPYSLISLKLFFCSSISSSHPFEISLFSSVTVTPEASAD